MSPIPRRSELDGTSTIAADGKAGRRVLLTQAAEGHLCARFHALGGPCEILLDVAQTPAITALIGAIATETWRIEDKFSRYNFSGVVYQINSARGAPVQLDAESAALIDYAAICHRLSDGLFDITSGILRQVWRFDGSHTVPTPEAVQKILAYVGWDKVRWDRPCLQLQPGMEIDLGGIGKEYAVDRAALLLEQHGCTMALVNFGGDLRASGPRRCGAPWMIGIDDPRRTGHDCVTARPLSVGAMATSGDARRFILHRGQRYGHILDPRTGWPVRDAPRSVTVQAPTCLEAGMLSTFAILHGAAAETFLQAQGMPHLIVR